MVFRPKPPFFSDAEVRLALLIAGWFAAACLAFAVFGIVMSLTSCGPAEPQVVYVPPNPPGQPSPMDRLVDAGLTMGPTAFNVDCRTRCGALLVGSSDCEGFQDAEDRALRILPVRLRFMHKPDIGLRVLTMEELCTSLEGWKFSIVGNPGGDGPPDEPLWGAARRGVTHCDYRWTELGSPTWAINAYAHEVTHVLLGCDWSDDHYRWGTDVYAAIAASKHPALEAAVYERRMGKTTVSPGAVGTVPYQEGDVR